MLILDSMGQFGPYPESICLVYSVSYSLGWSQSLSAVEGDLGLLTLLLLPPKH